MQILSYPLLLSPCLIYSARNTPLQSNTTEVDSVHKLDATQIQKAHDINKAQSHNLEALLYTVTAVVIDTVRVSPAILREVCHIIE